MFNDALTYDTPTTQCIACLDHVPTHFIKWYSDDTFKSTYDDTVPIYPICNDCIASVVSTSSNASVTDRKFNVATQCSTLHS